MRMLTKMTMAQLMMTIIFASKLKTLHNIFELKEMLFDTSKSTEMTGDNKPVRIELCFACL